MKKLTLTIFILSLFLIFSSNSQSNNAAIRYLKEGNKIIFIRHALAPGRGDPPGFKIDDCKTQRNLNKKGINQSKKIGKLFKKNKVPIDQVLSSQWCRCRDTAKYAFGDDEVGEQLVQPFILPFKVWVCFQKLVIFSLYL